MSAVADANAAQLQAADPAIDAFVIANAGTGKTKVLVDRVTRLLLKGAAPDRILCLTYTKAAASEMQERLFDQLGAWSVEDDDALKAKLAGVTGRAPRDEDVPPARRLFARALETPGGLKVQTIHAFCERLLRQFPVEAGAPPGFDVLEDAEAARLAGAARGEIAERALTDPAGPEASALTVLAEQVDDRTSEALFRALVDERAALSEALAAHGGVSGAMDAVRARLGIEAGATPASARDSALAAAPRAAMERAADHLRSGTKTDVAAADRIDACLAAESPEAVYEALKALCLTRTGEVPVNGVGTKGARAACPTLVDLFGDRDAPGSLTQALLDAEAALRAIACAERTGALFTLAEAMIAAYERRKAARRALDFADLIELCRALLLQSEARDWVRYKLDGGIDHILVDEAQDTAPRQWELVDALAEEFFAGEGGHETPRSLFAVGDEKQSIYSFQGADPARFLAQVQQFIGRAEAASRPAEQIPMQTSFRSSPAILAAVDRVFRDEDAALRLLPGRPPGGDLPRHVSGRPDAADRPGAVELWPAVPVPDDPGEEDPWAPVDAPAPDNAPSRLAALIADAVKGWIEAGVEVWDRSVYRPMHAGDVMILLTRRGGLFYEIIRRLKLAGVEVAGADRLTLAEQQVVRDLLSIARFALLPEDDLSLAEALKSPLFHPCDRKIPPIDDDALFDLCHGRRSDLWSALRATADPRFAEARDVLGALLGRVGIDPPYALFAGLLNRLGRDGASLKARVTRRLGREAEDALDEFLSRALAHQSAGAPSLQRFAQAMERESSDVKRELGPAGRAARVMTVHGAKGLEAPLVILPDTTMTPKSRSLGLFEDESCGFLWSPYKGEDPGPAATLREAADARGYGEYLRLLYVAMTRARDRLVVCGHRHGQAGRTGGRVDPDSWHARVEAALDGEAEPVDTPAGRGLRLGADAAPASAAAAPAAAAAPLPDWIARPARVEADAPRVVAPSRLQVDEAEERPGFSPLEDEAGMRYRRGSLIHKLLEILPEAPPGERSEAARLFLERQPELDEAARADIADSVFRVLEHPEFSAVFGPGSRAEVSVSGGAPGLPEGVVVNGQIDRLAVTDHAVLVVDYKTNRPPPETVADTDAAYLRQMAAYRAVLRDIFPGRSVACALLWTESATLMTLPDAALDDALAGLGAP